MEKDYLGSEWTAGLFWETFISEDRGFYLSAHMPSQASGLLSWQALDGCISGFLKLKATKIAFVAE